MPRMLHYVSGIRLIVDRFDPRLWHFTLRGQRYDVRVRGASFLLYTESGALLGRYADWGGAIAAAKELPGPIGAIRPSW